MLARPYDRSVRAAAVTSIVAAAVIAALFAGRVWHGLWFAGYSDETTHLLGGRMINAAAVLYRDFVDNHGPVIYILTSTYGWLFGWSDPNYARLIPVLLISGAGASIAASQVFFDWRGRFYSSALFFALMASLWLMDGYYLVSFYAVSGALAVVVIARFWVPMFLGLKVRDATAVLTGVAAAFLGFTAYSYMPTAALFAASGLWAGWWRQDLRPAVLFILGGIGGSVMVLAWLVAYADIVGYFAFHIALNLTVFRFYNGFGLRGFLASFNPSSLRLYIVQTGAVFTFAIGGLVAVTCSIRRERRNAIASVGSCLLGLASVAMLNPVGALDFKNGAFVMAVVGLFSIIVPVACASAIERSAVIRVGFPLAILALLGLSEAVLPYTSASPGQRDRAAMDVVPVTLIGHVSDDPLSSRIRSIVPPGETFLALEYSPELYWAADRFPMQGFFAYFPWDADYARSPSFNRPHDLCEALRKTPPKVIVMDKFWLWSLQPSRPFEPCVTEILATQYHALSDFPKLYVRSDLPEAR